MRVCAKCGLEQANSEFYEKENRCRSCRREYQKLYKQARMQDPDFIKRHNSQARETRIRWYGISPSDYEEILKAQGGKCAGCGYVAKGRQLDIDHAHQTRDKQREPWERSVYVRGCLCHLCNRIVGFARDNPETLRNLANYLENPPAVPILKRIWKNVVRYLTKYEKYRRKIEARSNRK